MYHFYLLHVGADSTASRVLHDLKLCHPHQNHIIAMLVMAAVGVHVLSFLYSFALLLRTSGYFLRLHQAVRQTVESKLKPIHNAEPSLADRLYNAEVMQYYLANSDDIHENTSRVIDMRPMDLECDDSTKSLYRLRPEELLDPARC